MSKEHSERRISRQEIYKGKIFDVYKDQVELENNATTDRELVEHSGGVATLAITPEDKIIMVRQFRYGSDKVMLELPAGKINAGEDPEQCALRELKEETGYSAKNLLEVCSFYPTPAYCSEKIHIFYADKLEKGEQDLDPNEFLSLEYLSFNKALMMCLDGTIEDAKTLIAILYYAQNQKLD